MLQFFYSYTHPWKGKELSSKFSKHVNEKKRKKKHFLGTSRDSRERKNFFMVIAPKIGPIHR